MYATTYEVLVGVAKLIAPFAPFIADEMYISLTGEDSVHTTLYPRARKELIDEKVEERMDLARDIVGLGRGIREKERIKVRQPLNGILVEGKYKDIIEDLVPLITEELNVKNVEFSNNTGRFMNYTLKPNFREAGPVLGGKVKAFGKVISGKDPMELVTALKKDGKVTLDIDGESVEIPENLIDVRIDAKEGFAVAMEGSLFVILDTKLDGELMDEGYAREIVSKIQQMRKKNDYEMMDNIRIYLSGDEEIQRAVEKYEEYIKTETLALDICKGRGVPEQDINGHKTDIDIERV